jgi:O-methyltransferase involved in polyketide biosynthesis
MRPGRSSGTAALVASLRGLCAYMPASSGLPSLISDPYGINLSGAPWTWLRFACTAFPRTFSLLLPSFVSALTTRVAIRTRVIDDAVRAAVAKGATQILILGAGLDAR